MSRARHAKRANGGPVKADWNAGESQNAAKEAEEKARGGKVGHMKGEGMASKMRADRPKRASGGSIIARKDGGSVPARASGGAVPGRAKGGRMRGEGTGADLRPLTTAANVKHVTPQEAPESGDDKVM